MANKETLRPELRRASTSSETSTKLARPPPLRSEASAPLLAQGGRKVQATVKEHEIAAKLGETEARLAESNEAGVALLASRDSARAELEQVLSEVRRMSSLKHHFRFRLTHHPQLNAAVTSEEEAHEAAQKLRIMLENEREEHGRLLEEAKTQTDALLSSLHDRDAAVAALTSELEAARVELSRVREEMHTRSEHNAAALAAALATHVAQTAALQAAEDVAAAERAAAQATLQQALEEVARMRAALAEAESHCASLSSSLAAAQSAAADAEARCASLSASLNAAEKSLEDAESRSSHAVMVCAAEHEARLAEAHARVSELAQALAASQSAVTMLERRVVVQAEEDAEWRMQFEHAAAADLDDALAEMRKHYEDLLESSLAQNQRDSPAATTPMHVTPRRVSQLVEARAATPIAKEMSVSAQPVAALCDRCRCRRLTLDSYCAPVIHDDPNAPAMGIRLMAVAAAVQTELLAAGPVAQLFAMTVFASLGQQSPAFLRLILLIGAASALASAYRRA